MVRVAGAVAGLYAARRYYRNWGTTKGECRMRLPGDELVKRPVVRSTEGVWIDAPAELVWPWLRQMGQDRGGLYTFETVENMIGLHYRNADTIHPEWQRLTVGDSVRLTPPGWLGCRDGLTLEVEAVTDTESIVLRANSPQGLWDTVWSFHLVAHWDDRCRLLVRTRARLTRPGQAFVIEFAGPIVAFVTRGMLMGIKRRAQQQFQAEASAARASHDAHEAV